MTGAAIERSYELARQTGARVSLDLIFAAPGERLRTWQRDLDAAIAAAAGSRVDVRLDDRTRHSVLEPSPSRPSDRSRRRAAAADVRNGDRYADRRRVRTLRSVQLCPAPVAVRAQPGLLAGSTILRRRPRRGQLR